MSAPCTLPNLLELGELALPSAVGLQPIGEHAGMVAAAVATHRLHGTGTGTYHAPRITIDAGTSFTLTGTANLARFGTFLTAAGAESLP